jgi:hypothetical protein
MSVLLVLVGLLTLASGAVKLRSRVRTMTGHSPLAVVEALLGATAVVGSGLGLSRVRTAAWTLVVVALGITLTSTWVHTRRVVRYLRKRQMSEEWRLKAHLLNRAQLE